MNEKMHIHFDKEGDYLEIRFGKPTVSRYERIAPDTYARLDEKSGEPKGYAVFNVSKSGAGTVEFEIPAQILKRLLQKGV